MFKDVPSVPDFPGSEEKIINFWKKNKTFEKSIEKNPSDKTWTFLDGPPFITGLPHYGTLLASLPKDLFPRYWTMKGYRVRRVWGWDCHGLPAENKVEGKLGIKRKKDIEEKIGIKKFINECKLYVSQVSSEWEWYVDHIARWVDFKNSYKTMDTTYMETVMWVFKQMYDKGYIYKGLRVSLYCPHCSTPISNFEVAMDADNYKEFTDPASVYKYQLKREKEVYILAWSTTPWNKIVTPALAVNPKLKYVKVKQGNEYYILAKSTLKMLNKESKYKIVAEFTGKEMVGKEFVPHYDYYTIDPGKKAFEIISGDFVTADEGTGVVTIAAYGEEDLGAMKKEKVHIKMHLDEEGNIKPEVPLFGGMYYLKANKFVEEDLAKRGLVYRKGELLHSVPLCWRCHTRLYYAPQDAWYVNVQILKEKMKITNEKINWVPSYFKYGRFLKSMEAAPDWCISRSRYWGSPVPVWECSCGERFVPGSIKELEERSGEKITDLHKPTIDEIKIRCQKCQKTARRVSEVLDSWIEAGSASLAEHHYPFDKNYKLEDFFPPDFIVEYTGQIRAWFYVVHVIANAVFNKEGFKNVLVNGVILGTDGRKMSKNYGNYPDPKMLLSKYGGDALRLYLLSSPVMMGGDILISEKDYRSQITDPLLLIWNSFKFFITYANLNKWQNNLKKNSQKPNSIMDKWLFSRLYSTLKNLTLNLEKYDSVNAIRLLKEFVSDLSTWYIRRSRDRFINGDNEAFITLYRALLILSQMLAPIAPFISEEIYKNLTGEESVHLTDWPKAEAVYLNKELEETMLVVRKIVELGHAKRKEAQIKVRQPLKKLQVISYKLQVNEELEQLIKDELNVKEVEWKKGKGELEVKLDIKLTPELRAEGEARDLIREIQSLRKKLGCRLDEQVIIYAPSWPLQFTDYIKKKTLAQKIIKADELKIGRESQ